MRDLKDYTTAGAGLLIGAGVGAGLMYLLDPDRGRARRARLEDQAKGLYRDTGVAIDRVTKDVTNRAHGLAADLKKLAADETPAESEKLVARVRAKLGRLVKKPHDVQVAAAEGLVLLTGEVEAHEAGKLLAGVIAVPGVKDIDNQLKLRHLDTKNAGLGAGAIASVAGGLITFAGLRALKQRAI